MGQQDVGVSTMVEIPEALLQQGLQSLPEGVEYFFKLRTVRKRSLKYLTLIKFSLGGGYNHIFFIRKEIN